MAIVRAPVTAALFAGAVFAQSDYLTYVGGYGPEIDAFRFHAGSGRLTRLGPAAESPAASFLLVHPNGRYLYAVHEEGRNNDAISAFAIDHKSGKLTLLNTVPSHGSAPCHLALDKTARFLAVSNYADGTVAVFQVLADGRLGELTGFFKHSGSSVNPARQKEPHAHCVNYSPDNRFLLSADLGADKIFVYRFDAATGAIAPNEPAAFSVPPGSGPRHIEFNPNGRILYVLEELSSAVEALHYDPPTGTLDAGPTVSALPEGFSATNISAELALNASATLLYASNRGHDSIALFNIDPQRGFLSFKEDASTLGKTPRHFTFDPTGGYLLVANQDSDSLIVFKVHPTTGELRPTGPPVNKIVKPACIAFVR
jgi:6-phosphogluconolactonase